MPGSRSTLFLALVLPLVLGGCILGTAVDVATAPVKVASKAIDLATTSQSEADQARGREIRRREERLARLERDYDRMMRQCHDGRANACRDAIVLRQQIEDLLPQIPVEPV